jgi:Nuclease A inhibitor-like protein
VLHEHLTCAKVYRIGAEGEKVLVVVGKTADGKWAGVKTTIVEA